MARDERFRRLNGRFRRVAVVGAGGFLGWYFVYVALAAFAREFMSQPIAGHVNVALLLGVLQFASTFLLAAAFSTYARRRLDRPADELRAEADGPPAAASERAFGRGTEPWDGGGPGGAPSGTAAHDGRADGEVAAAPGAAPPASSGMSAAFETSGSAPVAPRASDGRWDVRMGDIR